MSHHAPSLLDKLLGLDEHIPGQGAAMRLSLEQVKQSVARDIEALLNAHAGIDPAQLAGLPLAARSVLTLGLTDISALSMASDRDRDRVRAAIARALTDHEPRLRALEVDVPDSALSGTRLCFTIRAQLVLNPEVEPVAFDAVLQPGSKRYTVSRRDGRATRAASP